MRIVADDKIPGISDFLSPELELVLLPLEEINSASLKNADLLIGRSVLKVNQALLEDTSVQVVGTCTSGTDHIDTQYLQENNITLFSAPGSNAQGVSDYVLWVLAYYTKNKDNGLLDNKKAGIIGAGHVGSKVGSLLQKLGLNVIFNDPLKAEQEASFFSSPLEDIAQCDLICVHPALTKIPPYPSYHLLSASWWKWVKKKAVFINAARGGVIDTAILLKQPKNICLCLDVFEDEPNICQALVDRCFVATPHVAGHTIESFYRATQMIVEQVHAYLDVKYIPEPIPKNTSLVVANNIRPINASDCRHWYDVILKCYNFYSKLDLTPSSFYTLRNRYRDRHDFSVMRIQHTDRLSEFDRSLLKKLQLQLES